MFLVSACMLLYIDSLINPAPENSDSNDVLQGLHPNETGTWTFVT